eukprot:355925-Chlamydomonas_euryale.AAC.7
MRRMRKQAQPSAHERVWGKRTREGVGQAHNRGCGACASLPCMQPAHSSTADNRQPTIVYRPSTTANRTPTTIHGPSITANQSPSIHQPPFTNKNNVHGW